MKRHPRSPASLTRAGVTLTEVLVAMFVMALGMISILTLFPLGAMQVGQALKDDRCSQAALQADGYVRSYWRHQVAEQLAAGREPGEPFYHVMDEPNLFASSTVAPRIYLGTAAGGRSMGVAFYSGYQLPSGVGLPKTTAGSQVAPASANHPAMLTFETIPNPAPNPATTTQNGVSYTIATQPATPTGFVSFPVIIDPLGWNPRTGLGKFWAAGQQFGTPPNFLLVPRRTFATTPETSPQLAFQVASMSDDLTFQMNGTPDAAALARQGRYTWAALVQRPKNEARGTANLTVMVFDGRSTLPGATDEVVGQAQNPAPAAGDRSLGIDLPTRGANDPVLVRRGGWVLHAPMDGLTPATFYRISGFTEIVGPDTSVVPNVAANTTRYALDIESPLKFAINNNNFNLYFFAGLSEVFTRPQLTPDVGY